MMCWLVGFSVLPLMVALAMDDAVCNAQQGQRSSFALVAVASYMGPNSPAA